MWLSYFLSLMLPQSQLIVLRLLGLLPWKLFLSPPWTSFRGTHSLKLDTQVCDPRHMLHFSAERSITCFKRLPLIQKTLSILWWSWKVAKNSCNELSQTLCLLVRMQRCRAAFSSSVGPSWPPILNYWSFLTFTLLL